MSRSDDNLDHLFKDAFSDQGHGFDPTFWDQTKHVYKAPSTIPSTVSFYTKPFFIAGIVSVITAITATTLWFSNSTPENQIAKNNAAHQTQITISNNQELNNTTAFEPSNNQAHHNFDSQIEKTIDNQPGSQISLEKNLNSKELSQTNKTPNMEVSKKGELPYSKNNKTKSKAVNTEHSIEYKKINSDLLETENKTTGTPKSNADLKNNTTQNTTKRNGPLSVSVAKPNILGAPIPNNALNQTNQRNNIALASAPIQTVYESNKNEVLISNSYNNKREFSFDNFNTNSIQFLDEGNEVFSPDSIPLEPLKRLFIPFSIRFSTGNMWSENLVETKNNIVNYSQSKNLELSLEYHFKPHWGAEIGFSYNQQSVEQTHYYPQPVDRSFWDYQTTEITLQNRTWWLGGWYYYPSYQDTITDTVWVTKIDTLNTQINAEHKIKMLEIPLLLTYNLAVDRWNFQVASGASIGFYTSNSGNYLSTEDHVQVQNTIKGLFNNIQYNYLLRTEVAYSLTEHWQLSARPQIKVNLNSIYNSSSGYGDKFLFYGLNAGIIYRF